VFRAPGDDPRTIDAPRRELVGLLLDRGARHHVFSAVAVGDLDLIQQVVEENPYALDRRLSRFEQGQTPLHFAIERYRYDILDLLIALGADLEAENMRRQTPLMAAMLSGDREAMRQLAAAGARQPPMGAPTAFRESMSGLATSVAKGVPMIHVPDVARALDWYTSIGFRELARYDDDGLVNFGMVSFGRCRGSC
jgi:hypothetical protein